jgi:hypothetical protein
VQEVRIDESGNVWFGSFGGLTRYNPAAGTWTSWDQAYADTDGDHFPASSVDNLICDGQGGVWLGFYPTGAGSEADPFVGGFAHMKADGNITSYKFTADYDSNINFYNNMFNISQRNNKLLDIHTRILPNDFELVMLFNKIALSVEFDDIEAINNLNDKYKYIKDLTNIRAIQVVNNKLTIQDCLNYINTMKDIGIKQITFRQMFGNKKAYEHFDFLKENIKDIDGVMFLKDGEYHSYYFTTNNTLYPYFFGYTEADRMMWMKIYEDIEQSCS